MSPLDHKTVSLFNTLLELHNSRLESYQFAAECVSSSMLKALFARLSETSMQCQELLTKEIYKLGGVPCMLTCTSGSFFNAWLKLHAAIMMNSDRALVAACVDAEEVISDEYLRRLRSIWPELNRVQKELIEEQLGLLAEDGFRVSNISSIYQVAA